MELLRARHLPAAPERCHSLAAAAAVRWKRHDRLEARRPRPQLSAERHERQHARMCTVRPCQSSAPLSKGEEGPGRLPPA